MLEAAVHHLEEVAIAHFHVAAVVIVVAGDELRGDPLLLRVDHMAEIAVIDRLGRAHEIPEHPPDLLVPGVGHMGGLHAEHRILREARHGGLQILVVHIEEVGVLDERDQFLAGEHGRFSRT